MFDLTTLNGIFATARYPEKGKPLDRITNLAVKRRGWRNMRNCQLFKTSDTTFHVDLWGNRIVDIEFLPDGRQRATVYSVDRWTTNTTADRIRGTMGLDVAKYRNHIRFSPRAMSAEARQFSQDNKTWPALAEGMSFIASPDHEWVCENPERIPGDEKQHVNRERAKPVIAAFRKLDKLAIPMLKLGAISSWDQVSSANIKYFRDIDDLTIEARTVERIVDIGHSKLPWHIASMISRNIPISTEEALGYYKAGVVKVRQALYKELGVLDEYRANWTEFKYDRL
jgi:hypothetical protein